LSSDTELSVFTVDGEDVLDGDVIELEVGTTSVDVVAEANDMDAQVLIQGKTGLVPGSNNLTVRVTAADGTVFTYRVTLNVKALNTSTVLKRFTVNGTSLLASGSTLSLPFGTRTITLVVETEEDTTSFTATGTTNLVTGANTLSVRVVAESGKVETYTRTLTVVPASTDTALKSFSVNGLIVPVGSTQVLAKGATSVNLLGVANSPFATAVATAIKLKTGLNTLTITVTSQSGAKKAYTVKVIVPKAVLTVVVTFPKVGVLTVDSKTNKAGNALLLATVKKVTAGKTNIVAKVEITNNFLISKDKSTAGAARAANVQKLLKALKTNSWSKAIYLLKTGAKTQKGTTVTIYYY
jgi:hypothetical protein